jgi:hypothetical protein
MEGWPAEISWPWHVVCWRQQRRHISTTGTGRSGAQGLPVGGESIIYKIVIYITVY